MAFPNATDTMEAQVLATNVNGDGPESATGSLDPVAVPPVLPPPVLAPDAPGTPVGSPGQGSILWQWAAGQDNGAAIDSFDVQWRIGSQSFSDTREVSRDYAYWEQTGLGDGVQVFVQVRARNSEGSSLWSSSPGSATTLAAPDPATLRPTAPGRPTGTAYPGGDGVWNWALPSGDGGDVLTGFDFQSREPGVSFADTGGIQTVEGTYYVLPFPNRNRHHPSSRSGQEQRRGRAVVGHQVA